MQSGASLGRYYAFTGLNIGSITVPVEPVGTYRSDNLYVFDTRVQKEFRFRERYKGKCCKSEGERVWYPRLMRRNRPELFKGRHFEAEIIVLCVRWYLRF